MELKDLILAESRGEITLQLQIWHCQELPVGAIDYGQGFPNIPYICPVCKKKIINLGDLMFDIKVKDVEV